MCDICGKSEPDLKSLLICYQTESIKDICSECLAKVDDHLWKLKDMSNRMNENFLKRFMENWKRKLWVLRDKE